MTCRVFHDHPYDAKWEKEFEIALDSKDEGGLIELLKRGPHRISGDENQIHRTYVFAVACAAYLDYLHGGNTLGMIDPIVGERARSAITDYNGLEKENRRKQAQIAELNEEIKDLEKQIKNSKLE